MEVAFKRIQQTNVRQMGQVKLCSETPNCLTYRIKVTFLGTFPILTKNFSYYRIIRRIAYSFWQPVGKIAELAKQPYFYLH